MIYLANSVWENNKLWERKKMKGYTGGKIKMLI